jgi:hypothetical protein
MEKIDAWAYPRRQRNIRIQNTGVVPNSAAVVGAILDKHKINKTEKVNERTLQTKIPFRIILSLILVRFLMVFLAPRPSKSSNMRGGYNSKIKEITRFMFGA